MSSCLTNLALILSFLALANCICQHNETAIQGVCTPCDDNNCADCTNGLCTKCKVGFGFSFDKCTKCLDTNCVECDEVKGCLNCNPGFTVDTSFSGKGMCKSCGLNCGLCKNGKCAGCVPGYAFNAKDATCTETCPADCSECHLNHDEKICDVCNPEFGISGDGCKKCEIKDCQLCDGEQPTIDCKKCKPNQFVHRSLTCTTCPKNCLACKDENHCTECANGFYLDKGLFSEKCEPCKVASCFKCKAAGSECEMCQPGTFLSMTSKDYMSGKDTSHICTSKCSKIKVLNEDHDGKVQSICFEDGVCPNHMITNEFGHCQDCKVDNCIDCESENDKSCLQCSEEYYLKAVSTQWEGAGYPLASGECLQTCAGYTLKDKNKLFCFTDACPKTYKTNEKTKECTGGPDPTTTTSNFATGKNTSFAFLLAILLLAQL